METNNYFIPLLLRHLKLMNIKCAPKQLQLILQSAPTFPSLLSIVQTYTYFGLKVSAYRANYQALTKISIPIIAHIKQKDIDRFILIYKISESNVSYYDAFINKKIEISKDIFCTIWSGVIILSKKANKKLKSKSLNIHLIYTIIFIIFVCIFFSFKIDSQFLFFYVLLGLNFAGIWLAVGLLRQESNGAYSIFDKFCHINEAFDCTKVIQSKASKLLNKISLADIGFIYFTTGIISLCIGVFSNVINSIQQILFYLTICSLPFILFSILYQKIVIKKWCTLCLSVMIILLIEIILFFFFPYKTFSGDFIQTIGILFFSFISSIEILFLVKRDTKNQAKIFNTKISFLQLKRSSPVITSIFGNQKIISQLTKDSLIIGNTEAPITITTFLNLTCTPCKNLAIEMIRLLECYPSFIQWHIRLDGLKTSTYNKLNEPQLYLFEIFKQNNHIKARLNIIEKWFRVQSIPKFSKYYPLQTISKETIKAFSTHISENNELKVEKVPSIWINNRVFPEEYSIKDIPFLLTDLNTLLKSIE